MTEPEDPTLDVSRNLRAIVELSGHLRDQALHRAAHRELPGGDATAELGPVANVGAVELRNRLDEAAWLRAHGEDWCESCESTKALCQHRFNPWDEDPTTLTTLRWWTEEYRARTNTVTERWTIASEAWWLIENMRWVNDHEVGWHDFEQDMKQARSRLEALLYAGVREERSRVPCIDCDTTRDGQPLRILLVVHYAGDLPGWVCPECRRKGNEDHWYCPRCRRQYNDSSLRLAEAHDLERRGVKEWQPVAVAAHALEVPLWSVKRIARACDISTRGLLVHWPDARNMRRQQDDALRTTVA